MTSEPEFELEVFSWVENIGENLLTGGDLGNTDSRVYELPNYLEGHCLVGLQDTTRAAYAKLVPSLPKTLP